MALRKEGSGEHSDKSFPPSEQVVASRAGDVLIKNTLLKADHFPGCQNTKLTPLLDGAPNFRQVEGLPVYGVAIPTVRGLRNVMDALGAAQGQRRVLWHNMREEPVLYINGKPYVVREADQPFCNVEYTGINRSRVEDMEARLKRDVLREAARYDNHILVTEEDDDMNVIDCWEPVTESDVQTPMEVYAELSEDGYVVDYTRVPVTDEKAPKDSDFELLIQRLWNVPTDAALVFNCQMGRGRTTTGMIIATLLVLRRLGAFPIGAKPFLGMYGVVRSLLRVLERGIVGKAILDAVVDACSAMQNLREAIATYRGRFVAENKESRRATIMGVCLEYLERYYMLIAFACYLTWPKFDPASSAHVTFKEWIDGRPELRSVLSRMLRRNPLAALELHIPAATLPPGTAQQSAGMDEDEDANQAALSQAEARADVIIESRTGSVLGALTILKEDYFPGMKSTRLPQILPGAGNFRRMAGLPVYGVAMCTLDGIRNVLRKVLENAQQQIHRPAEKVLWFNMREEPVVYINGLPFVLREQQRPMKNLQEYAGIDAERLERMEARLKQDVLAEAGELIDMWETLSGASAVQTPAEVYASLAAEGFPVQYLRVPVTDGRAPQPCDIDAVVQQVRAAGFDSPMVFSCQMGAGRTTTGTVIGGLLAAYGLDGTDRASAADAAAAAALEAAVNASSSGGAALPIKVALLGSAGSTTSLEEAAQEALREEIAGDSPRHSEDEPDDSPVAELRLGSSVTDMWSELSQEELQERVSLAGGGYVGVRRVVRLLEHGDNAKRVVDALIDANSQMLNLRVSIMRYRRPRLSYHNHKSEVAARHSAFSRGSSYLERYCMLIAFGAYLDAEGPRSSTSFQRWLGARPELQQVLKKRRGKTLNRRIILKSYLARAPDPSLPPGTPDVRQACGLPVFAVGNVAVDALARLLVHLGAGPKGNCHIVVTDAREELVVYVNGVPYIRRELEMPAAALHHAGVHARQLEVLEAALKEDVAHEAAKWGGRVLLHQEVMAAAADAGRRQGSAGNSSGGLTIQVASARAGSISSLLPPAMMIGSFLTPPSGPVPPIAIQLSAAAAGGTPQQSALAAAQAGVGQVPPAGRSGKPGSVQLLPISPSPGAAGPSAAVAPLADGSGLPGSSWPVSPGLAAAMASPSPSCSRRLSSSQVQCGPEGQACNAAGDVITAPVDVRRIPLSRERTPVPSDMQDLMKQMLALPAGVGPLDAALPGGGASPKAAAMMKEAAQSAVGLWAGVGPLPAASIAPGLQNAAEFAGANGDAEHAPRSILHLVVSRTATGSSARFATAAFATFLTEHSASESKAAASGAGTTSPTSTHTAKRLKPTMTRTMSDMGEYRGIMSVVRLLPGGTEVKRAVDDAIDTCSAVGHLRDDIKACKHSAEAAPGLSEDPGSTAWAARQLGVHYLKRYFLLIAFRCYLVQRQRAEQLGRTMPDFSKWMDDRRELGHLLTHLNLDT
eukprot:gene11247-11396_t